ncbi:hypothetical protein [Streptomyces sp. Da 82-17]|uniref:hypothetical protein n=1 Tax=Streptomyces sp. Da 82-17 TaxID=3377116 RepID=UPI0038D471FE
MSVFVTKTSGHSAEITWDPEADDPQGYIGTAIESDQLAYALEALGDPEGAGLPAQRSPEQAVQAAASTAALASVLKRRSAQQVVYLHDELKLGWRTIAKSLLDDPEKQSSIRRMYNSAQRQAETKGDA